MKKSIIVVAMFSALVVPLTGMACEGPGCDPVGPLTWGNQWQGNAVNFEVTECGLWGTSEHIQHQEICGDFPVEEMRQETSEGWIFEAEGLKAWAIGSGVQSVLPSCGIDP